jgi:hypothetical protein
MASSAKTGSSTAGDRRRLVHELAQLPARERRTVIAEAQREAQRRSTLSWGSLRASRGVVTLGGDSVADCDSLYDG